MKQSLVEIQIGDLFESTADTLVIPCSTAGTMSTPFIRGLERLGIPVPTLPIGELGLVNDYLEEKYFNRIKKKLLFAISVDNQTSNYDAVERITRHLAMRTKNRAMAIRTIACPLFGTGAGKLEAREAFRIMRETFEITADPDSKLIIYINDKKVFDLLSQENQTVRKPIEPRSSFYAAGAMWSGEDQYQRFIDDGIWENGHTSNFTRIVNTIKPDDIIILKYSSDDDGGYLRIKAMGRVIENLNDGHLLRVNWETKDLNFKLHGLSGYRDTISLMSAEDVALVLNHLAQANINITSEGNQTSSENVSSIFTAPSRIANLIGDAITGTDYLDISKDVEAFARVMAYRKFSPPLAISLFGKWGTGKSFFMQKLRDRIDELTHLDSQEDYCPGIAQIHFNAWSYLDANLWASLVSRIFEGLQEYITGDDVAKEHKEEILSKLTSQLVITYEEVSGFEAKKKATEDTIKNLEKEQKELRGKLDEKITNIQKDTLSIVLAAANNQFKVKEELTKAFNANPTVAENEATLKKIIPEKYWEHPEEYYKQLKSTSTFLLAFFQKKNIGWNLLVVGFLLVCIFVLPHFLKDATAWLKAHDFSIPQLQTIGSLAVLLTPIIVRAKKIFEKYKPFIAAVWEVKEKHQLALTKATDEFLQKEKSIQLEIRDGEQQLQTIIQQLQQAQSELQRIDFKIKNAIATEALYSFIEKRCKSEDYKNMLGIVSIIRKDFETLSSLFSGHNTEQFQPFEDRFQRPLSRIILYIDDLDRCPEDRVVEVLEAVNLLMAFPLFIVVVGVDPRWVKNALVKRYQLQFTGCQEQIDNQLYEKMQASDYLEKIFQVPFHLKPASTDSVKQMIRNLTAGSATSITQKDSGEAKHDEIEDEYQVIEQSLSNGFGLVSPNLQQTVKSTVELSNLEIMLLEEMSVIVGSNPRAVKRFVNTYQIVRGHAGFAYMQEEDEREFLVCLFLLALPNGKFRDLNNSFVEFFEQMANERKTLNSFLAFSYKTGNEKTDKIKSQLNIGLSENAVYDKLQRQPVSLFKQHYQFIRRFTFEDVDI